MELDKELKKRLLIEEKNEITGHIIYSKLAERVTDATNSDILKRISEDEKEHYNFLNSFTGEEVKPNNITIQWYLLLARTLGLTFVVKLLERDEENAQEIYGVLEDRVKGIQKILQDEEKHVEKLIAMIDEKRLEYIGSIVLGLNDALVELTGTLAGLSFAFQNTNLIALSGLITGIAASMSMAASEFLSSKAEGDENARGRNLYRAFLYNYSYLFGVTFFHV